MDAGRHPHCFQSDYATLAARIGIHTGPIVADVIGTHKFVYDVWGDTVNTASRMESHSLPGRIQLSAATRTALGDAFAIERRGVIQIKGKGTMETLFSRCRELLEVSFSPARFSYLSTV